MSNKVIIKNSFVMPYIDDTVDVTVSDTKDLSPNCWLWNESVGYLQVIKYSPYSDIITLENIGRKENALHGTVFPTCMEFLISAPTAIDLYNNMSTCLAADFNSPLEGQEALMSVDSTYVMKADDQIIVDREYRYLIVEVINSTTLKVRNEGMGKEGIIEVGCDSCVPVQVVSKLNCCPIPSGDLISNTSILSIADGIDALLSNAIITLDTDLSKYNNTVSKFITLNDVPRGTLSSSTTVLGVSGGNNNVLGNISLSLDTDLSKYNNTTSAFITLGDIPRGNLFTNSTVLTVIDGTNNVLDNIELYLDTDLSKYNNTNSQFLSTSDKKNLTSTSSLITITNGTGATLENTSLDLDTDLSKYNNTNSQFLSTSDKKNLTSTSSLITVTNGTGATLENTSLNLDTDLSLYDNSSSKFISVGGIPSGALISNSTQLSVSGGSGATLSNVNLTLDADLSQYDNSTSDFVNSTQLATKQDVIDANNPLSASYVSGLASVATSGDYGDLINTPTIPTVNDAVLTIQKNSTDVGTFTANASSNATINITVPTDTGDLTNGAGYITSASLPTVNDATLTIQNNGTTIDTFTANSSTNTTVNITVPTDTNDLTNGAGYITGISNIDDIGDVVITSPQDGEVLKYDANSGNWINGSSAVVTVDWSDITGKPSFATVATSGDYTDLINTPTIPTVNDATLTIQKNSSNVGTFTANASSNVTIDISVPTDTGDLTNNAGFITSSDIPALPSNTDLSDYDNSNSGFITSASLPTVNDATLTIQKNSTNVGTFTANANSNATINITVPTKTSELTNNSNFVSDASYVHTDNNFTSTLLTKLNGIAAGAEVNVQSDWTQATTTADDYIKNKPTLTEVNITVADMVYGGFYRNQSGGVSIPLHNYLPLSGGTITGNILPNNSSRTLGNQNNYFGNLYTAYVNFVGQGQTNQDIAASNTTTVRIRSNGKNYNFGSGTGGNVSGSDEKLKKNVKSMSDNTLDVLNKLRPIKFDYINEDSNDSVRAGFIAQEVDLIPEMYSVVYYPTTPETDDNYGIDYAGFVPYLVKAIQELSAKVNTLEDKLKSLGV